MSSKFLSIKTNSTITYLLFSVLLFLFIIYLIFNDLIFFYINPITSNTTGEIARFGDWTVIPDAILCMNKGFDVYKLNPCDLASRPHVYGELILHLPLASKYNYFYTAIVPFFLTFLTIVAIVFLFKPKTFKNYLLIALIIFSTPIMLLIERANSELIIFLFLILISYSKNYFLTHILIFTISGLKFYPIVSALIFFFENKFYKLLLNILVSLALFIIIIFISLDGLKTLYANKNIILPATIENVGIYIFSFQALPQLAKTTFIELEIFNPEVIFHTTFYGLILFIILLTIFNVKFIIKTTLYNNLSLRSFEEKLFLLSSAIIVTIYFFPNMNYIYKEIYFIGLLPYLNKHYLNKNTYYKYVYNLIILKFIMLTIFWILQTQLFEESLYIKGANILLKNLFDNFLVVILLSFIFIFFKKFFINFNKINLN